MIRAAPPNTLLRASFLALIVVSTLAFAGCSSSKKASTRNASEKQPETVSTPLKVGSVHVESYGPDVKLDAATQAKLLAAAQKYVDTAVYAPLQTAQLGPGYDTLFENAIRGDATGADVNTLTDMGIGHAGHYTETATPVAISGLADDGGKLLYAATSFRVNVAASTPSGDVKTTHDVEFTFAPHGSDWAVTAYRVKAKRVMPDGTTTTTANSGSK